MLFFNLIFDAFALLGVGKAGNVTVNASDRFSLDGSFIFSTLEAGGEGNGGQIKIDTGTLNLTKGSQILTSVRQASNNLPAGIGNAGNILINARGDVKLDGIINFEETSGIGSDLETGAVGNAGNIEINSNSLYLTNNAILSSRTLGMGNAGNITINAVDQISSDRSRIFNQVTETGRGRGGDIAIATKNLSLTNGSQLFNGVFGIGDAGNVTVNASDSISFDGRGSDGFFSGIFSTIENSGQGNGGNIDVNTKNFALTNGGQLNTQSFGLGNAGNINLNILEILEANNGEISTSSNESSGGTIKVTAGDINLRGDSDIRSNIFSGAGGGGNIDITADSIIAFDDSDIFAFARDGRGGNINLDTPAYFAENFTLNSLTSDPDFLDNNSRADLNATGAVSGSVAIPDVSFIQNSLTELENNSINTDELVANSCVSPVGDRQQGKFIITGGQSLPVRPGDGIPSKYPTGEVRNVPESNHSSWQPGDPIVEPQGAYRLANGKLVLSRECN